LGDRPPLVCIWQTHGSAQLPNPRAKGDRATMEESMLFKLLVP